MSTEDRAAIVTGASRGMGRAIVSGLAEDGFRLVVDYRERERDAQELVEAISRHVWTVHGVQVWA